MPYEIAYNDKTLCDSVSGLQKRTYTMTNFFALFALSLVSYMNELYECVQNASSICGKDAEALTKKIIDNYAGELTDSVCAAWRPGSNKCNALPKIKPVSKPTYQTFVPSLVEVLSSLSN